MPTVSEVLGGLLENALRNPKTTISSILTTLLTGIPVLLGTGLIHGKAATILFGTFGACKVILGTFYQKDAGTVLAKVPGMADPQMVPAHPIPDDPKAKAVVTKTEAP